MPRTAVSGRIASTRTNSILYNGSFEVVPTVNTNATNVSARWIDGTAAGSSAKLAYGWGIVSITAGAEANFDTNVPRSGTHCMRLDISNITSTVTVSSYRVNAPVASSLFELFTLLPNTSYTLNGYIRTANVPALGAFIELREFNATGGTVVTTTSNKLSGTDATWRNVTLTVTTGATTRFGGIFLRNNVAGNVCTAWFDDITLIPSSLGRVQATGRVAA